MAAWLGLMGAAIGSSVSPGTGRAACIGQEPTCRASSARSMMRADSPSPEARAISPATMMPSQVRGAALSGAGANADDNRASHRRRVPGGRRRQSRWSGLNSAEEPGIAT